MKDLRPVFSNWRAWRCFKLSHATSFKSIYNSIFVFGKQNNSSWKRYYTIMAAKWPYRLLQNKCVCFVTGVKSKPILRIYYSWTRHFYPKKSKPVVLKHVPLASPREDFLFLGGNMFQGATVIGEEDMDEKNLFSPVVIAQWGWFKWGFAVRKDKLLSAVTVVERVFCS